MDDVDEGKYVHKEKEKSSVYEFRGDKWFKDGVEIPGGCLVYKTGDGMIIFYDGAFEGRRGVQRATGLEKISDEAA